MSYDTTGHVLWPYDDPDESDWDEYNNFDLWYSDKAMFENEEKDRVYI